MNPSYAFRNFKELSQGESEEVLQGRNDPQVRQWMTSDRPIMVAEHRGFMERLAQDARSIYIRIERHGRFVGVYSLNDVEANVGQGGFWVTAKAREQLLPLNIVFQGMNHMFRHYGIQRIHGRQRTDNHGAVRLNALLGLNPCPPSADDPPGYEHIEVTRAQWENKTCQDARLLALMGRMEQLNPV